MARHRADHRTRAPIGPVLAARYGQGEGERALSVALMRRDFEARLREINGLAVVAKAKGVPVCLVELLRFALWAETNENDINLLWMMEFQGAVAAAHRRDELMAAE